MSGEDVDAWLANAEREAAARHEDEDDDEKKKEEEEETKKPKKRAAGAKKAPVDKVAQRQAEIDKVVHGEKRDRVAELEAVAMSAFDHYIADEDVEKPTLAADVVQTVAMLQNDMLHVEAFTNLNHRITFCVGRNVFGRPIELKMLGSYSTPRGGTPKMMCPAGLAGHVCLFNGQEFTVFNCEPCPRCPHGALDTTAHLVGRMGIEDAGHDSVERDRMSNVVMSLGPTSHMLLFPFYTVGVATTHARGRQPGRVLKDDRTSMVLWDWLRDRVATIQRNMISSLENVMLLGCSVNIDPVTAVPSVTLLTINDDHHTADMRRIDMRHIDIARCIAAVDSRNDDAILMDMVSDRKRVSETLDALSKSVSDDSLSSRLRTMLLGKVNHALQETYGYSTTKLAIAESPVAVFDYSTVHRSADSSKNHLSSAIPTASTNHWIAYGSGEALNLISFASRQESAPLAITSLVSVYAVVTSQDRVGMCRVCAVLVGGTTKYVAHIFTETAGHTIVSVPDIPIVPITTIMPCDRTIFFSTQSTRHKALFFPPGVPACVAIDIPEAPPVHGHQGLTGNFVTSYPTMHSRLIFAHTGGMLIQAGTLRRFSLDPILSKLPGFVRSAGCSV